jgi:hypothetical protein
MVRQGESMTAREPCVPLLHFLVHKIRHMLFVHPVRERAAEYRREVELANAFVSLRLDALNEALQP